MVAFVYWQARSNHPLLPLRVLTDRMRAGSFLAVLISGVGVFGVFLFLTYYLQLVLGYSPIATGLAFMPMTIGLVAAATLSTSVLLPRFGPRLVVTGGLILSAIGMVSSRTDLSGERLCPQYCAGTPRGWLRSG